MLNTVQALREEIALLRSDGIGMQELPAAPAALPIASATDTEATASQTQATTQEQDQAQLRFQAEQ